MLTNIRALCIMRPKRGNANKKHSVKQALILTGFMPLTLAKSPLAAFHAAY